MTTVVSEHTNHNHRLLSIPLTPTYHHHNPIPSHTLLRCHCSRAHLSLFQLPDLSPEGHAYCDQIISTFSLSDAQRVKSIESTTKHDMKAVEYFLKEKFTANHHTAAHSEYLHFACTSEDVNNLAYALLLAEAKQDILLPIVDQLVAQLRERSVRWSGVAMLSRTHGQSATPTTVGKELANFVYRLGRQRQQLAACEVLGKMNGAVGNFNAHTVAYPAIDWQALTRSFVEDVLGLRYNPYTTQIEPHDYLAEHFDVLRRINTVLLALCRDMWYYISLGYFKQRTAAGEVGSSTMPHKVNPIDWENAEGNVCISNALLSHMADKLPVSRMQRDLSDSTVLRNIGTALAHSYIAHQSALKGLAKADVDQQRLSSELSGQWEVLGEAYQTVMRREGVEAPYERLKAMTRGKKMTEADMREFVEGLEVAEEVKAGLRQLTPNNYVGLAEQLAKKV